MLKDELPYKLFKRYVNSASVFEDLARALKLWKRIQRLTPQEIEERREEIEDMHDTIEKFDEKGQSLSISVIQEKCLKYLQDELHTEFMDYLDKNYKKCPS